MDFSTVTGFFGWPFKWALAIKQYGRRLKADDEVILRKMYRAMIDFTDRRLIFHDHRGEITSKVSGLAAEIKSEEYSDIRDLALKMEDANRASLPEEAFYGIAETLHNKLKRALGME